MSRLSSTVIVLTRSLMKSDPEFKSNLTEEEKISLLKVQEQELSELLASNKRLSMEEYIIILKSGTRVLYTTNRKDYIKLVPQFFYDEIMSFPEKIQTVYFEHILNPFCHLDRAEAENVANDTKV